MRRRGSRGIAPVFLTIAGIISAVGLASCCAIPLFLLSVGIGASWMTGVALLAAPFRTPLLEIGAISLGTAAVMWFGSPRTACAPGSVCAKPLVRGITLLGLLGGAVLLYFGYVYV